MLQKEVRTVSEQRKRLERALRGCAERGVPAHTVDLWPAVRERVIGERISEERISEERVAARPPRRRAWPPRLVPNTPLGWTLAVFSVLILAAGAYAASGPVGELFRYGLPGPAGPGVGERMGGEQSDGGSGAAHDLFRYHLPGGEGPGFGEEIGQKRTMDGARVTLERAYADEEFVVFSYSVQDLKEDRRNAGNPAALEPIFVSKEDENAPSAPDRRSELTDEGGRHFASIDGTSMVAEPGSSPEEVRAPKAHTAVFEAPEGLEPSRNHRFRLEIFLEEVPVPTSFKEKEVEGRVLIEGVRAEEKPPIGPFVFGFEVSVRPVPVVEVGQKETTKGITLTLERVINSPGRPQAIICIEPPDDYHLWHPSMEQTGFPSDEPPSPHPLKGNCWSMGLGDPVEGPSSVTVTEIWGIPQTAEAAREDKDGKEIRGPWTFEFEAPAP
jgi:hypothetical protein